MTWRCPHCGTPQPEAARCWVCRRSSTCCGTCRYFSRAVVSGLGFCLLDRRRLVRRGDELEACWTARTPIAHLASAAGAPSPTRTGVPLRRTFVPVLSAGEATERGSTADEGRLSTPSPPDPWDDVDAGFWRLFENLGSS
ncbi:MAG TPA: hypothetical protein VNO86_03700 [Candidatus Binatia bacterium]|nr:hypothetical protein [Candidatus Binatia bacterium]